MDIANGCCYRSQYWKTESSSIWSWWWMESSSIELCRSKQVVELNGFPEHTNLSASELQKNSELVSGFFLLLLAALEQWETSLWRVFQVFIVGKRMEMLAFTNLVLRIVSNLIFFASCTLSKEWVWVTDLMAGKAIITYFSHCILPLLRYQRRVE